MERCLDLRIEGRSSISYNWRMVVVMLDYCGGELDNGIPDFTIGEWEFNFLKNVGMMDVVAEMGYMVEMRGNGLLAIFGMLSFEDGGP
jgi:hypothetical protein